MIMKKVLNITEHKDGTYSLKHLTFEQMHAIQNALIQNTLSLGDLQGQMWGEGRELNPMAAYSLKFAVDASCQLLDMGF